MKISTYKEQKAKASLFEKVGIFAASLLVASSAVYLYSPIIGSHADTSAGADVKLTVGEVISLNLDKTALDLNASINSFVLGTVNAVVSTNSQYGYSLTLEDEDADTNMVHTNENVDAVVSSDFDGKRTSSSMSDNTWGFSLDSTNFSKIPVNGSPVTLKHVNAPMTTDSEATAVDFGVKVGILTSGTYTDKVVFTAYANGQDDDPDPDNPGGGTTACSHNDWQDTYGYYGTSGVCTQVQITWNRTLGNTASDTVTSTVMHTMGDPLGDDIPEDPVWPGHTFLGWRNGKGWGNVHRPYITAETIPFYCGDNPNDPSCTWAGVTGDGAATQEMTYYAIFSYDNCDGYALADGGCWNKAIGTTEDLGILFDAATPLCAAQGYGRNPSKEELENLLTYYEDTSILGDGYSVNGAKTSKAYKYSYGYGMNGSLGDALGGSTSLWTNLLTGEIRNGRRLAYIFVAAGAGSPSGFELTYTEDPYHTGKPKGSICIRD